MFSKHSLKYAWIIARQLNAAMSSWGYFSQESSSHQILISHPASIFELKNSCIINVSRRWQRIKGDNFFKSIIYMLSNPFLNYHYIIPIILVLNYGANKYTISCDGNFVVEKKKHFRMNFGENSSLSILYNMNHSLSYFVAGSIHNSNL